MVCIGTSMGLPSGPFSAPRGLKYCPPLPSPATIHSNTCGNFFRSIFPFFGLVCVEVFSSSKLGVKMPTSLA